MEERVVLDTGATSVGEAPVTKVTVEEKGFFRRAIPTMPRWLAWVCLWLSLVPGLGKLGLHWVFPRLSITYRFRHSDLSIRWFDGFQD